MPVLGQLQHHRKIYACMSGWREEREIVDASRATVAGRASRSLHDLKLVANDRGSGGLTFRPFLSVKPSSEVSVQKSSLSLSLCPSLSKGEQRVPFSGKSKQVPHRGRRFYQYKRRAILPNVDPRIEKDF